MVAAIKLPAPQVILCSITSIKQKEHKMTTLVPAYGRDYKTAKDVKADWEAGKDFRIADISSRWDGSYCSREDFSNTSQIMIRFNNLTKITKV